jgi:hypothetical protein
VCATNFTQQRPKLMRKRSTDNNSGAPKATYFHFAQVLKTKMLLPCKIQFSLDFFLFRWHMTINSLITRQKKSNLFSLYKDLGKKTFN